MPSTPDLIPRRAAQVVRDLARDARVVVVNGPRQVGKSSLLRAMTPEMAGARYVSLDDTSELRFARTDPAGFVHSDGPLLIDEIQRGGDPLVLAIKSQVDRDNRPGRYVLAGSTRFLTEPRLSESLAGRARFVDLWPLAQAEIDRVPYQETYGGTFFDNAIRGPDALVDSSAAGVDRREVFSRILRGGYPESIRAATERSRRAFFADYVRTISQRDITELSRLAARVDFAVVLRLAAARTANELNISDLANDAGLGAETARRYLPLLEAVFLVHRLPAWGGSITNRSKRRPKLHLFDSGLAAHLVGASEATFARGGHPSAGPLLETFVVNEILKQRTWSDVSYDAGHWRDSDHREVDLVLESPERQIVAIEVKAALDVHESDFRHLAYLRDKTSDRFVVGVLLHCGDRVRRFGDRLLSVPMSVLW